MGWIVLAVAFAAVWVYAFYREDFKNPEPLWLVGLAILAGMASVLIATRIEARLATDISTINGTIAQRIWLSFFVAGPVEESCKIIAVTLLIWFQSNFDEPMDGIVYAAAAAAGFALAENFLFMQDQPSIILVRGPAATGAHILFAGFWGGALGHAKKLTHIPTRVGIVALGLLLGFIAHGIFDLATWSAGKELTVNQARAIQIGLMGVCAAFLRWRIRVALRSPLQLTDETLLNAP